MIRAWGLSHRCSAASDVFSPRSVSALLSPQPSRAEDTNSTRHGYCQPNKSQQCREPEVSAACQTKRHVSALVSALHQPLLRLIFFTPENTFSLLPPVVVFLKGSFRPSLLSQQICRTLDSKLHAQHPKVNVPVETSATGARLP